MKNKYGYRIMGKLYHKAFKSFSVSKTINDFFDHVLKVPCTPPTQADIFHFDYYSKQALLDFQNLLSDQDKYVAHLESRVKHLSGEQRRDFNSKLYSIVTSVENYSPYGERTKEFDESGYRTYESRDLDSLAVYLSDAEEHFSLSYNIYLLIYLSVYKCLPRNFFFGTRYMPSLMEFNEEVTCKYGINSRPGTRAIINLVKKADAKDVNIFALYEYAEMLFYGIQNGPEPDINAAFEAFKSISNMNDGSPCHPLAHWSLSFIYFNYRQRGSELEDCDIIPELDDMELIDRVTKSLIHAKYAFILTKNPAAANILGKICMLTDDDVPGIEEIIKKHRLKTAVDYFEEATKQNYIYAFGSLSNVYLEKMFEDPTNQEYPFARVQRFFQST